MKLIIASRNPAKASEIGSLLSGLAVTVIPLAAYPDAPHIPENGRTFSENAVLKAVGAALHTGLHALADDSGLCVDALDGRPGIYSARYAGPGADGRRLCRKLLKEMRAVHDADRTARFECCIVMAGPDGNVRISAEGVCHGIITRQMRGGYGFGYDPVFLYPPAGKTFAQMKEGEKHRHSHRGLAMRAYKENLKKYLADEAESGVNIQ